MPLVSALNQLEKERLVFMQGGCILFMNPQLGDLVSEDVLI